MRCSKCGREAILYRKYSGEALCERHFSSSVEEKVVRELRRGVDGERFGVAVSGGKDSMSLLYIAASRSREVGSRPVALLVDEGIRGYRDVSRRIAERFARELDVEFHAFRFEEEFGVSVDDIADNSDRRGKICTYCGVFRRRALELMSRRLGLKVIATGHTADDVAQTILLNVIQGNFKSLAGSERLPGTVRRIKPLSGLLEREVALYAYIRGVPHHDLPCPYSKGSLRNDVRNFLLSEEARRPGITFSVKRLGERLRSAIRLEWDLGECRICGFPTTREVCKFCELLSDLKGEEWAKHVAQAGGLRREGG